MTRKKLFLELFRDQIFALTRFERSSSLLTDLRRVALIYYAAEKQLAKTIGTAALENSLEYSEGIIMRALLGDVISHPSTPRTFLMSREFSERLLDVDLKISSQFLPPVGWSGVIEFPFPFPCSSDFHHSAVVAFGTDSLGNRTLAVLCPDFSEDGSLLDSRSILTIPILDGSSIEECIDYTTRVNRKTSILYGGSKHNVISAECMSFILKCCTYIVSSHPDVAPLIPPPHPTTSKSKKIAGWLRENYPLPVARVGHSFHGKITRHVGETLVRGHFRWQPFSTGLSKLKLIWIDEHTRCFSDFHQPLLDTPPT